MNADEHGILASADLPRNFRKLSLPQKRQAIADLFGLDHGRHRSADWVPAERPVQLLSRVNELAASSGSPEMLDLADVMVENAIGLMPIPLGIAEGFIIDGHRVNVPMATEEPSVIAAASFAGSLLARHGGNHTEAGEPEMTAQIFVEGANAAAARIIADNEELLKAEIAEILVPMTRRGGGYRGIDCEPLPELNLCRVHIHVDTRNAMGANLVNTIAERLKDPIVRLIGGEVLMAILSNAAEGRLVRSSFRIPVSALARAERSGAVMARRIELGSRVAETDSYRAVTHNKGILNGITAVALATGNDTRAIEAACHRWAARDGAYRSLTRFRVDGEHLTGTIEVPLAFATVGGAVSFHPVSRLCLRILGNPSAVQLSRIAASVGLAQNLAAVSALVGEGIQQGHMRLHANRLAWYAGARGLEVRAVGKRIFAGGVFNQEAAEEALEAYRAEDADGAARGAAEGNG